jgi:hypothetical protein
LELEKMALINGGSKDGLATGAGVACGLAISGGVFGGFGIFVTGAIFGPTCIGLAIGAAVSN